MSVDPYEDQVVGRDPLTKTLVEAMVKAHPNFSDVQVSDRIRDITRCPLDSMTPQIVAYWRNREAVR